MSDQLNPFRIDGEVERKTPGQVVRMYIDGARGALGGAVRAPYVAVKAIDDVIDVVKGNDLEDDVAVARGLKYMDDAANVITPDSEIGRLSDEFIGQNIAIGGAIRQATKPLTRTLSDTAQFMGAPIAGQVARDAGASDTAALAAEIAVGGAPMNFGNHRNRNDVFIGRGTDDVAAHRAMDDAEGIYRDTGGANYGHGEVNKKQADKLREEVRRDTGAFVGPDGLARVELADSYFMPGIDPDFDPLLFLNKEGATFPLSDVPGMQHILDMAPEARAIRIAAKDGRGGSYDKNNYLISIGRENSFYPYGPRHVQDVLGHELQHGLQHVTMLPRGGNHSSGSLYSPTNIGRFSEAVTTGKFTNPKGKKVNLVDNVILDPEKHKNAEFMDMIGSMRGSYEFGNESERYQRILGEAEARSVQTRAQYTDDQRRAISPLIYRNFDGEIINPRTLTVQLGEVTGILGSDKRPPMYGVMDNNGTIAPNTVHAPQVNGASMASKLSDQARVRLGWLYDNGYID